MAECPHATAQGQLGAACVGPQRLPRACMWACGLPEVMTPRLAVPRLGARHGGARLRADAPPMMVSRQRCRPKPSITISTRATCAGPGRRGVRGRTCQPSLPHPPGVGCFSSGKLALRVMLCRSLAAVPHWAPATSGIERGIIRARARLDASTTSGPSPRHSQQPHVATFPGTRFAHQDANPPLGSLSLGSRGSRGASGWRAGGGGA